MPDAPGARPTFLAPLLQKEPKDRLDILQWEHPAYREHKRSWQVLLDAFEGTGGFLDGSYLWPYPRESQNEFEKRAARARYHNYLETLVDLYVRFMFTQGVTRKSANAEYDQWLEDVDGTGTGINDFLKRAAAQALSAGHAGILIDKTSDEPTGPTKADEKARPIAAIFPPTAIVDWRFLGPKLESVKLHEVAPEPAITDELPEDTDAVQYLLWQTEGWGRFDYEGNLVGTGMPNLGMVPLAILRPKPRHLHALMGRALVSNANVVRAIFNRNSEEDNVLRDSAFSMLTVSIDKDGNVQQTKEDLGSEVGSTRAIVARGQIEYKTPDQTVAETIRENAAYLVREIYRAAHVRFQRDSLDTESGSSIRLQYSELNEMLQGFAKALKETELQMARAYFAWQSPTAENGQQAFEAAKVEIQYPDEFFLDDLGTELTAWADALRMNLGPTMSKRIKKKAARRVDPDIPPEDLDVIDGEIDGQDEQALTGVIPFPMDTGQPDPEMEPPSAA